MSEIEEEIKRRTDLAMSAIILAAKDQGSDTVLFAEHHLQEIPGTYWHDVTGNTNPSILEVLSNLVLQSHWGEEDDEGIDTFDFTLPDEATNYVLAVQFDESGDIEAIVMES